MIRDLQWSVRQASRHFRSTCAVVGILALTCAAATALFSTLGPLWLSPFSLPEADRLVVVWEELQDQPNLGWATSIGLQSTIQRELGDLGDFALSRPILPVLWMDESPSSLKGARVTTNFLKVLGIRPAVGRDFRPQDEEPTDALPVVISDSIWRSRFGAERDLQKLRVRLDFGGDALPAEVIGVLPAASRIDKPFAWQRVDILTVLPKVESPERRHFSARSYRLIGRLGDGADLGVLQQRGAVVAQDAADSYPAMFDGWRFRAQTAIDWVTTPYLRALKILSVLTALVLLIACLNIAIILAARHRARAGELDLRVALGAGPWSIPRLLLTEGLLLAALAAAPGLIGAYVLLELLHRISSEIRLREIALQWEAALFAFALCGTMAVFFSFLPAALTRRAELSPNLGARASSRDDRWQRRLLSFEIAAGVLILTLAITITYGFLKLTRIDPGFSAERVLAVDLRQSTALGGARDPSLYQRVVRAVTALPQVESAGVLRFLPMSGKSLTFEIRDRDDRPVPVAIDGFGPNTVDALKLPILEGRAPTDADLDRSVAEGGTERPVWISQTLSERLAEDGQVGRPLSLGALPANFQIAGIVGDIHRLSLADPPQPTVYVTYNDLPRLYAHLLIRLSSEASEGDRQALHQTLGAIDPRLVIEDLRPLKQLVASTTERERIMTFVCLALTILGLAMTTSGVWAVAGHRVQRRRREMGIRLALGAPPNSLQNDLMRLTLTDVLLGLALGGVAGVVLARAATDLFLDGIEIHWSSFSAAALWLVASALVTTYLATRRLRRLDPAAILHRD